jgi:hypothetical protein
LSKGFTDVCSASTAMDGSAFAEDLDIDKHHARSTCREQPRML